MARRDIARIFSVISECSTYHCIHLLADIFRHQQDIVFPVIPMQTKKTMRIETSKLIRSSKA